MLFKQKKNKKRHDDNITRTNSLLRWMYMIHTTKNKAYIICATISRNICRNTRDRICSTEHDNREHSAGPICPHGTCHGQLSKSPELSISSGLSYKHHIVESLILIN